MSVYTRINHSQLQDFLNLYSLGTLIEFSGIQAGIENTNYKVSSSQGDFILTLFESLTAEQLPCYFKLLNQLNQSSFPAPKPQPFKADNFIHTLLGKPAAIFNCLPGQSIEAPSLQQCAEIGEYLAKLHLLSPASDFHKENPKNLKGCQQTFNKIKAQLTEQDINLLESELSFQSICLLPNLPQGVIHADLFKDNVLFYQGKISGILDFYNACTDYFLFDIAITCNDWCIDNALPNPHKIKALLSAYQNIKPLSTDEKQLFMVFLRRAALRFWLSRLEHQLNPKQGELTLEKDPLVFKCLLEYYKTEENFLK